MTLNYSRARAPLFSLEWGTFTFVLVIMTFTFLFGLHISCAHPWCVELPRGPIFYSCSMLSMIFRVFRFVFLAGWADAMEVGARCKPSKKASTAVCALRSLTPRSRISTPSRDTQIFWVDSFLYYVAHCCKDFMLAIYALVILLCASVCTAWPFILCTPRRNVLYSPRIVFLFLLFVCFWFIFPRCDFWSHLPVEFLMTRLALVISFVHWCGRSWGWSPLKQ